MSTAPERVRDRIDDMDWERIVAVLDRDGVAALGAALTPDECSSLVVLYDQPDRFRSTIDMARHRFGQGQYRYFAHPLPDAIVELRAALWPRLLPVARDWAERLHRPAAWPDDFERWIADWPRRGPNPTDTADAPLPHR